MKNTKVRVGLTHQFDSSMFALFISCLDLASSSYPRLPNNFTPISSMRIKKSILRQMSSSQRNQAIPNLDPTTNLELHEKIWSTLRTKIETHLVKR
jgi:hypothetical protein